MSFFSNNFLVCLKRLIFIITFLLLVFSAQSSLAGTRAKEKIGILYSYKNVETYRHTNTGEFDSLWDSLVETLKGTNFNLQYICNISLETKPKDLGVSVLFYPLAIDLDPIEKTFLDNYLDSGGKLIISSGSGLVSQSLKQFLLKHNVSVKDNVVAKTSLGLEHNNHQVFFELPAGNFYTLFDIVEDKKIAAKWKSNNLLAIAGTKNLIYIGYGWGQDLDRNRDIKTLIETINFFWDNVCSKIAKEITGEDYKQILKEITALKEEAISIVQISEEIALPVRKSQVKKHFDKGVDSVNGFSIGYVKGDYLAARESAISAKSEFATVSTLGLPSRRVEIRAIWLDRGTIIGMKTPDDLRKLIKNLSEMGFNVILFETINAGYPIYPSKLLPQNPQAKAKGWDPLKVAVEAAHQYGVELHAWVWTFAVGNTRHNLIVGESIKYPGPIIAQKGRAWALLGNNGKLRIEMQPESWISPANKKATAFLKELFSEVVINYDVDGLQLDYIRFPFQKKNSQVGFDFATKEAFRKETGKFPQSDGVVNKLFVDWKVKQINNFVQDISVHLKSLKPGLKLSVAVFAIDRGARIKAIQQDWETWAKNRWIDFACPFYYSYTPDQIKFRLERNRTATADQSIIIPAFNLRILNTGDLSERLTEIRNAGVLGVSLFATEHIDEAKRELLTNGPYREKADLLPYSKPFEAAQKLLDEFSTIIDKFTLTKAVTVLADSKVEKEVYYLTSALKNDIKNFTPDKSDEIARKIVALQIKVKEWLSLEKYLNREQRALYISSYLDQIKTLINYAGRGEKIKS